MTHSFAQQEIYDLESNVYGYELLYRSDPNSAVATCTDGDIATASVVSNVLLADIYTHSYRLFINYTSFLLTSSIPALLNPLMTVIEVLETVADDADVLRAVEDLSIRGYIIALDDYASTDYNQKLFSISKLIKLDFRSTDKETLRDISAACRAGGKIMLAEKIESEDDYIFAKNIGCTLFQGYYFEKPKIISQSVIKPHALSLLTLFSTVFSDNPDTKKISDCIKFDVALQVRLLRLTLPLNLEHGISSIEELIDHLGISRIRDWAYVLGLAYLGDANKESLLDAAFVRASFCSLIADSCTDNPEVNQKAFLMGSLSVLRSDIETAAVLNPYMNVDDEILRAIVAREGILGGILDVATHCEIGDFVRAENIAHELGLSHTDIRDLWKQCSAVAVNKARRPY